MGADLNLIENEFSNIVQQWNRFPRIKNIQVEARVLSVEESNFVICCSPIPLIHFEPINSLIYSTFIQVLMILKNYCRNNDNDNGYGP